MKNANNYRSHGGAVRFAKIKRQAALLFLGGLMIFLPMSKIDAWAKNDAAVQRMVLPGGEAFGVELQTKGVLVVGTAPVDCVGEDRSPAKEAGIKAGDIIAAVEGRAVNSVSVVIDLVADSEGKPISLTVERRGVERKLTLTPVKSESEDTWKAGVWIRDHTAGIGTVTCYLPESGAFTGLGHGICDSDTGVLLPFSGGAIMDVRISGIRKGSKGAPGELKGYFCGSKVGNLMGNTPCGVYGVLAKMPEYEKSDLLLVGDSESVREGAVTVRCTVDNGGIGEYRAKITKLCGSARDGKNFVIEITDPVLLAKTGGIVQGMSGSPVIQDGKLVGAITHVLLDEPAKGYGIFIENVLARVKE